MAAISVNLALISSFLACAVAQLLKLCTSWYKDRRWDSKRLLDSGGMSSSHWATVTALMVAVGLDQGTEGHAFALAQITYYPN
ncbi:hypothetical protein RchiOBHm_Chr2g0163751 [Rosa chinensis]|uniref:Acid phosphatase/vanadium-dependent haloperoxidase n=1 Tax=Rosa chinensis TaxID=74649 RepID=A0A2P6S3C4_ROSCH|nr:hypothetical protein RchiOBHm_Chr2g0163751 [Rosa chinensis]